LTHGGDFQVARSSIPLSCPHMLDEGKRPPRRWAAITGVIKYKRSRQHGGSFFDSAQAYMLLLPVIFFDIFFFDFFIFLLDFTIGFDMLSEFDIVWAEPLFGAWLVAWALAKLTPARPMAAAVRIGRIRMGVSFSV
jgi:hypothetical protein